MSVKDDITEKKRIALELDGSRDHLQELVASRTAELKVALAAAEMANRTKTFQNVACVVSLVDRLVWGALRVAVSLVIVDSCIYMLKIDLPPMNLGSSVDR